MLVRKLGFHDISRVPPCVTILREDPIAKHGESNIPSWTVIPIYTGSVIHRVIEKSIALYFTPENFDDSIAFKFSGSTVPYAGVNRKTCLRVYPV